MLNIVIRKLDQGKPAGQSKETTVQRTLVRGKDGKLFNFRTIDAGGDTLSGDLTAVFIKNVDRARRENKKLLGVRDIAPS